MRVVVVTLVAVAAIVVVARYSRYFARTHSIEVYARARERQHNKDLEEHLEAVEKVRLSGDEALRAGRYSDAEGAYRAALKDAERFGPENMVMASCYHDLAALYSAQEKFTEAEPLFRKAAHIWEVTRGPNHPNVATALHNLAGLLEATGRDAEAAPLEARVAAIRGASGGGKTR